jgi:inhibitor of Bruton tyrosine kinase
VRIQTELHLDRLVLLCAATILNFVNLNNACSVLADATYYSVAQLLRNVQQYLSINLETLLESNMLADLTPDLVKQLSVFIRLQQETKSPVSRSTILVDKAMVSLGDWLDLQDIPKPVVPTVRAPLRDRDSPKLSPPTSYKSQKTLRGSGPDVETPASPVRRPPMPIKGSPMIQAVSEGEDIFAMDAEPLPGLAIDTSAISASPPEPTVSEYRPLPKWKTIASAPR